MRHIVLDTETTGLSFREGHRIVEIGCVELDHLLPTGRTFHAYLNPKRMMDASASHVSGITDEMLYGKPEFSEVVKDFLLFLDESILVIHNAAFDMSFINGELALLGISPLPMSRAIDTVRMAREKFPGSPANLDALCRRFDVDLSARVKHGALLDAQLLAEVFLHLSGGRQPHLMFQAQTSKDSMEKLYETQDRTPIPLRAAMLAFSGDSDIVSKHQALLSTIKEPLWKHYDDHTS